MAVTMEGVALPAAMVVCMGRWGGCSPGQARLPAPAGDAGTRMVSPDCPRPLGLAHRERAIRPGDARGGHSEPHSECMHGACVCPRGRHLSSYVALWLPASGSHSSCIRTSPKYGGQTGNAEPLRWVPPVMELQSGQTHAGASIRGAGDEALPVPGRHANEVASARHPQPTLVCSGPRARMRRTPSASARHPVPSHTPAVVTAHAKVGRTRGTSYLSTSSEMRPSPAQAPSLLLAAGPRIPGEKLGRILAKLVTSKIGAVASRRCSLGEVSRGALPGGGGRRRRMLVPLAVHHWAATSPATARRWASAHPQAPVEGCLNALKREERAESHPFDP